jgi:hypothetical protein
VTEVSKCGPADNDIHRQALLAAAIIAAEVRDEAESDPDIGLRDKALMSGWYQAADKIAKQLVDLAENTPKSTAGVTVHHLNPAACGVGVRVAIADLLMAMDSPDALGGDEVGRRIDIGEAAAEVNERRDQMANFLMHTYSSPVAALLAVRLATKMLEAQLAQGGVDAKELLDRLEREGQLERVDKGVKQ